MSSTRAAVRQYALAGERGPTQENAVPTALTRYVVSRLEQVPSFHTGAAKFTLLFDWKPVPEPCFKRRAGDFLPDLSRYFFSGLHSMTRGPAAARPRPPYTTMSANPPASHHPPTGAPLPRSPQLPHKHIPLQRHRGGRSSDFFGVVLDSVSFCSRQTSTDGFKSVYNRLRCLHLAVPVFPENLCFQSMVSPQMCHGNSTGYKGFFATS